jgi:hypothetical protein
MQKIKCSAWLPRLSATGKGFVAAVSLLILTAHSLRAGEPALTLAVNQPSEKSPAALSLDLTPGTDDSLLNLKNSRPETAGQNDAKPAALSSGSQIESQTNFGQPKSLPLVREDSQPDKPVTVQAGYGRIWDDQSMLRKICADHQEPGCAYVSARFNF